MKLFVVEMEDHVCFLVLIRLACVLLQTLRKNPSKEGKARSSSGVAGPEKDPVVSHRNCYQAKMLLSVCHSNATT